MIEVELNNVKKNFGLKNILDGLSFEVKTGERIALIGANGSGKSTILKIIYGEEKPDSGTINIRKNATIGMLNQIYKDEEDSLIVSKFMQESFKDINIIEKEMKTIEEKMTLKQSEYELQKLINKYGKIQEKFISKGGYEVEEKFKKICSGFKLDKNILDSKYNSLSGGQKTIVNLAKILLTSPDILLLDEPTNHLDIETLEWLESFMKSYKGTIILVSHDRYFLDEVSTKTILLENGKEKIYYGNYTYFLEEDERRTLAQFEVYKNQQKQIAKMKESIKKLRSFGELAKNELFFKRAKSIEKRLEKMQVLEKVSLNKKKIELKIKSGERSGKDVLKIKDLSKRYGEKDVFNNVSFNVYNGEKVCLKGKNGSGKSTLIKIIVGEERETSGKIEIGNSVRIGYIPQEIKFNNEEETIFEYFIKQYRANENEIRTYLAKFMFYKEDVFKKLSKLSGGEKVRIKLAELMIKDVNFLILDEPTNHLDISTRELLEQTLIEYKGTILFVSHDRYFINKIKTKIIEI